MKYQKHILSAALIAGSVFAIAGNAAVTYTDRPTNVVYPAKRLFSGVYVAAGTGLNQQEYNSTGSGENSVIKSHVGLGLSDITPYGLFWAGEVQLGMNNTLRDKVGRGVFNNLGTDQGYKTKITETHNNVAGLVKVGIPVLGNSVIYGMAGPDVSGFKVKTKSNGSSRTKDELNVGAIVGAGFDTYITRNVSAGLAYSYTEHRDVKSNNLREFFSDLGAGNLDINHKNHKVKSNAVIANVAYRF